MCNKQLDFLVGLLNDWYINGCNITEGLYTVCHEFCCILIRFCSHIFHFVRETYGSYFPFGLTLLREHLVRMVVQDLPVHREPEDSLESWDSLDRREQL